MIIAPTPFKGEVPKLEDHLLPATCAQQAINCEFTGGSLNPLAAGLLLRSMSTNPVKGIYTEDGLQFYTWPVETQAFRSPIIDDTFRRMYYLQPSVGDFKVATTAQMAIDGGTPSGNVWNVGVPRPTVAPTLTAIDRTTLPDYPNIKLVATAWWQSGGQQYGSGTVTLSSSSALRQYTFTAPAKPDGTPADAVLAARVVVQNTDASNAQIMSITATASSSGRSDALPGTVEMALTTDGAIGTIVFTWGVAYTSSIVYTNLNIWGEESAPSPPAVISWTYLQDVKMVVTASSFTGYQQFSSYRFYRTYGANKSYLQMQVTGSNLTYTEVKRSPDPAGNALQTADWSAPPSGLQGMCQMPNGWFVGFKGDVLYMSEPYRPYAWPYSMTVRGNIRGVCAGMGGVVVTTVNGVSAIVGDFPNAARETPIPLPQPGIAQRSMTGVEGAVAYASNDGIVLVVGASATMDMSQKLFTRKAWRTMYGNILDDASMRFAYHDGFLVATSNTQPKGFILRLDEDVGALSEIDFKVDATFQLPVTDTLYYSQGSSVYAFRGANTLLAADWWSKDFVSTMETGFGCGFIRCDGPVQMTIYADGNIWYDTDADVLRGASGTPATGGAGLTTGFFRLPAGLEALRWSVRLRTSYKVYEFRIAATVEEMRAMMQRGEA